MYILDDIQSSRPPHNTQPMGGKIKKHNTYHSIRGGMIMLFCSVVKTYKIKLFVFICL